MRILVPVDGSIHSRKAIEFLAARRPLLGADPTVTLVNVRRSVPEGVMKFLDLEAVKAAHEEEGRRVFEELADTISASGLDAEERILMGEPGRALAEEANRTEADLIVMGTRGLNALKGLLLGSVSTAVLAETKTPLLLVRDETPVPQTSGLTVGIALDGSENGLAAVEYVLSNAEFFGADAKFLILHATPTYKALLSSSAYMIDTIGPVITDKEYAEGQEEVFADATASAVSLLKAADLNAEAVHLTGEADEVVADYADKHLDILVMGSHGRGNFTAAVLGSTASHIAAKTAKPLLIVRR